MSKVNFVEKVNSGEVLISDGSLATALYEKGYFINRSFEELSVTEAKSVSEIHSGFLASGAQLLSTNTFNAIYTKLMAYGLQDRLSEILESSVKIVREVAGDEAYVLGSIGPLGVILEPLGPTSFEQAKGYFSQNVKVFDKENVDAIELLSFHDLNELRAAVEACRENSNLPIIANISLEESLTTSFGHNLDEFVQLANDYNIEVIGMSGAIGPSRMLTALETLRPKTKIPISVRPNSGLPRYVNDQYIYLCTPDYLGKYAKRFVQAGANIVGGHSGVFEAHIKAIQNSVKMTNSYVSAADIQVKHIEPIKDKPQNEMPIESRSKLGMKLHSGEKVVSVELIPPKGVDATSFMERCAELEKGGVEFVNIPDGARAVARMSSLQLASYLKTNFNLEPIPHFTSRDRNLIGIQADLLGAHVNGVRNVLLVTGDPPKLGNCPGATAVYDVDAIGMTHIVSRMNKGLDLGGTTFGKPTEFLTGVALNPTASNFEQEIQRFKYKIEAGADYAITQPIYSIDSFTEFMDKLGDVKIPIIMGIWPLVSLRNAEFLKHEVPGVDVPDWVLTVMEQAGDDKEEAVKRGVEIGLRTIERARDLVQGFQVSAPFNRVNVALELTREV